MIVESAMVNGTHGHPVRYDRFPTVSVLLDVSGVE